ncbi:DNA-binding SAP [Metarhizium robertsii ARSEF 23]|uniref:DNA-binding SAP n=1 Tax=Metarhizium robertsii (strain ARSEF 23 / ATCC MYA-3075) TaxID=655844 RepID=E9ETF6_METRA|nr:DNA-binding SAP [Metarhizium robertsii ARSEF 23]EFZ00709.1 DNA-binding SAP [Metarhizium robertsii ARSEF 23]
MTDYNALKVPELKAILGQRKLPQTGNKQALIARLQEDDDKAAAGSEEAKPGKSQEDTIRSAPLLTKPPSEAAKQDEITYSDDEPAASKPAAATEPNPEEPAKEEVAKEEVPAPADADADAAAEKTDAAEPAEPAQSYAIGLASTAADEEAKKRAERAKRFGIEEDEDAKRRADRAKRFGLDQNELSSSLDSALPERRLKRGRGRDGDNRPAKRQSLDGRGRPGRGPRQGGNKERGERAVLDDAVEKAKAEKRAARFAAA